MIFKDHFSDHAAAYAVARPRYPAELFGWLATLASQNDLAWDCATGNGQAAVGLAEYFQQVVATDASAEQIKNAFPHAHVSYYVASAESPGLEPRSADLVSVAQALHWFNRPKFYAQVRNVLRPGGAIAVWGYGLCSVASEVDRLVKEFYSNEIGPWWPAERELVDEGYRSIEFPFEAITAPEFHMTQRWDLESFLAYLRSWSAVQRYLQATGRDPLASFSRILAQVWGESTEPRTVVWPLWVRAGRKVP